MSTAESKAIRFGYISRFVEALARFAKRTETGLVRGHPGFSRDRRPPLKRTDVRKISTVEIFSLMRDKRPIL
jgi:hypothetical protein